MDRTPSILVVDDDPDICEALELLLGRQGFAVQTSRHGGAALQMMEEGLSPDAILLDLMMPVMDGVEFLDALRRKPETPPPVVVMTASRHYDTDKLGVHAVLHKPFDIDKLVEVLRAAMKPN